MIDPLISMAFLTGVLGTGHCIGMCGGLVGALSLSEAGQRGGWTFHLLYNSGRIATYTVIGGIVGWLGSAMAYADHFRTVTRTLLVTSDLFVILIGLGTAGLFARLKVGRLEIPAPTQLLSRTSLLLRRLPPAMAALPLGLLFGFIPCGYLYAVAISAAQSADPVKGAVMLLVFGLGSTPALLLFGGAAHWLSTRTRAWMLRGAGVTVAAMGVLNLGRHLKLMGVWS